MKIFLNQSFLKSAKNLPSNTQSKLAKLLELAQIDPFHPLLHTKHLIGELTGFLSFRVTRDWRVIFYFMDQETIHLLKIAHRKDIYK